MNIDVSDITPARRGILGMFARMVSSAGGDAKRRQVSATPRIWPDFSPPRYASKHGDDIIPDGLGEVALNPGAKVAAMVGAPSNSCPGPHGLPPLGGRTKRTLDLLVAISALLLASPLMLAVVFLIKATTGGPVIFAHRRIGFNGATFDCYKFQTMAESSDEAFAAYLARNPQAAAEWADNRKLTSDPRVTFLGYMLRKSSLDELPQLFNILRGDMSCVGPRPIVADELERYGDSANDYLKTRPGLTGLWQVNGRNTVDYARRVVLDAQYVRTWSLRQDLAILIRTIGAVMKFDQAS